MGMLLTRATAAEAKAAEAEAKAAEAEAKAAVAGNGAKSHAAVPPRRWFYSSLSFTK